MQKLTTPKLTAEDRKKIAEDLRRNREDRFDFVRLYAAWLKKTPNKIWSKQHVKFLDK